MKDPADADASDDPVLPPYAPPAGGRQVPSRARLTGLRFESAPDTENQRHVGEPRPPPVLPAMLPERAPGEAVGAAYTRPTPSESSFATQAPGLEALGLRPAQGPSAVRLEDPELDALWDDSDPTFYTPPRWRLRWAAAAAVLFAVLVGSWFHARTSTPAGQAVIPIPVATGKLGLPGRITLASELSPRAEIPRAPTTRRRSRRRSARRPAVPVAPVAESPAEVEDLAPPVPRHARRPPRSARAARAFKRGNALLRDEQPEAAVAAFEACLDLDPGYGRAYRSLGIAHMMLGDEEAALDSYRAFVRLRPGDPDVPLVRQVLREAPAPAP